MMTSVATAEAHHMHAVSLLRTGEYAKALIAARQALDALGGASARGAPHHHQQHAMFLAALAQAMQGCGDLETAYRLFARAALLTSVRDASFQAQALQVLAALAQGGGHQAALRLRERYACDARRPRSAVRIMCVSDMHVDGSGGATLHWLRRLSTHKFTSDVLIVAGDVADSIGPTIATLKDLKRRFHRVFYVPGNHDLWLRGAEAAEYGDSFAKLLALRKLCDEADIDTAPAEVAAGLFVVPLLSWYNAHFDSQDPRPGRLRFDKFCSWPIADGDVWQVMLKLNGPALSAPNLDADSSGGSGAAHAAPLPAAGHLLAVGSSTGSRHNQQQAHAHGHKRCPSSDVVISASHFLPHPELPYARGVPELGKAVGCSELMLQLAQVDSDVHCYGHSHINCAVELEGLATLPVHVGQRRRRYVQYALEAAKHASEVQLMCVWDGEQVCSRLVVAE